MSMNSYYAQKRLNELMSSYKVYAAIAPIITANLGEGEFTRKDYNSKMPKGWYRRTPSPCLDALLRKGIVKVARTETFTIEKEGKGDEDFQFELPNGQVLSEEEFCEIPLVERLSMAVKVTTVKGKQKIEVKRNYYELVNRDKAKVLECCMNAILLYFED